MHGDEAINAYKISDLIKTGKFDYDPNDHHGPVLFYLGYLISIIFSLSTINSFDEIFLRSIISFASIFIMVAIYPLRRFLEKEIFYTSLIILCISPTLFYFSRYFIHETLMLLFSISTIVFGFKYFKSRKIIWLNISSVSIGLMLSTKETWPIFILAMLISSFIIIKQDQLKLNLSAKKSLRAFAIIFLTCFLFYSDFLRDIKNSTDFFSSFKIYLERGSFEQIHNHPWYYYLKIFYPFDNWSHIGEGILFLIFIFSYLLLIKNNKSIILRFLFWYTVVLLILFSAIPYKTPWNMISIIPGMIIVSSATIFFTFKKLKQPKLRFIFHFFIFSLLALQTYSYNWKNESHFTNPYVYAHPTRDVFEISKMFNEIFRFNHENINLNIFVIAKKHDYWPLPWYLRSFKNVGYWDNIPKSIKSASIILASPDFEDDLIDRFYMNNASGESILLIPLFETNLYLRPELQINGYIRKDILDYYYQSIPNEL